MRPLDATPRHATPRRRRRARARRGGSLHIERHRRASTLVTSNRAIEEWIPLFDDPILAQSALDRLAHNGHQVVMDGPSYRSRQRPGQRPGQQPTPTATPPKKKRK